MMAVTNFTVNFDVFGSADDGADVGVDADEKALTGMVAFTPVFTDERLALAPSASPRPAGFKFRTFTGYIDTDGRLKTGPSGTVGVRLWANDPMFGLERLVYRVDWNVRGPLGEPVRIDSGYFPAPTSDTIINLANELEQVGVLGAFRLSGGSFNPAGDVVFVSADGTSLPPIEIPEGYLVLVDNGDGTWSVG